jgi:hypothetical protein
LLVGRPGGAWDVVCWVVWISAGCRAWPLAAAWCPHASKRGNRPTHTRPARPMQRARSAVPLLLTLPTPPGRSPSHRAHLLDAVAGGQVLAANAHARRPRRQELAGQRADLLRPGGREHERLAVGARGPGQRADGGLKAEVKHAVGLVQDHVADLVQPGRVEGWVGGGMRWVGRGGIRVESSILGRQLDTGRNTGHWIERACAHLHAPWSFRSCSRPRSGHSFF